MYFIKDYKTLVTKIITNIDNIFKINFTIHNYYLFLLIFIITNIY